MKAVILDTGCANLASLAFAVKRLGVEPLITREAADIRSADRIFLKERAYPFLKDVATYLEQISTVDADGVRRLPLSSSPEIFDNSINAWFKDMTNYDLSLMHFAFNAASELASELELADEAAHWKVIGAQLPDLNLDEDGALTFAKGFPYDQSHRHFSHAMSIHPLGLIDWSQGEK